ncbi:MAG: hypothetical protein IJD66_05645 [Methanocorpusculum sp.]|nr:hypothetical protein [Methanocorpusculum sp.]
MKKPLSNTSFYLAQAVLIILFLGVGKALTFYEESSPSLGEFFYPATVIIGLIVGTVVMVGEFFIEQNPKYLRENPRPKTWGVVLITALVSLTIVLAVSGVIVSMFWHPDIPSLAAFTYLFGVIPAVTAVCILRYLPHKLPQKEDESY